MGVNRACTHGLIHVNCRIACIIRRSNNILIDRFMALPWVWAAELCGVDALPLEASKRTAGPFKNIPRSIDQLKGPNRSTGASTSPWFD